MRIRRFVPALALGLALAAGAASAAASDWSAHADEEVIEVVTTNEDESKRKTTIWIVVVDEDAYVRTGNTSWGRNAERDPDVRILTGSAEYDARVEFVTDEAQRKRVVDAFRAKYGWSDRLVSPFRGRNPKIMRLAARIPD